MSDKLDDPFSDFLYPFLDTQQPAGSLSEVIADVQRSTRQKGADIAALRRSFWEEQGPGLVAAAESLAAALSHDGQLLTMGNGGSATDAQDMAADFMMAGKDKDMPGWPAVSLTNDIGIVTAVGNDVGFDNVYLRPLIAYGRTGDVLVGFSTSGRSPNLLSAFAQAREMGLVTIGIVGYDGGRLAEIGLNHCLIVRSTYVPRIQEVHATIYHTLLQMVAAILED